MLQIMNAFQRQNNSSLKIKNFTIDFSGCSVRNITMTGIVHFILNRVFYSVYLVNLIIDLLPLFLSKTLARSCSSVLVILCNKKS